MTVTAPVVEGDGTTAAGRARHRWRRWAPWLGLLLILALGAGVYAARHVPPPGRHDALDPNGVGADGSRALAQVLGRHGVTVHRATAVDDVADSGHPVVVANAQNLAPAALRRLAHSRSELILIAPDDAVLSVLAPGVTGSAAPEPTAPVAAGCADPAARRAGTASGGGTVYRAATSVTSCFGGSFLRVPVPGHRVTVLGRPDVLTNGHIVAGGNAALALGVLGEHRDTDWLMSSPFDELNAGGGRERSPLDFLPRWFVPLTLMLLLTGLTLMLWRGRRLGRLVTEPLPVVVPAAEAVRGRATLYRAAGAYDRVLAAHRAAGLGTAAGLLGLPARSDPRIIADAWAALIGRPDAELRGALLEPPAGLDAAGLLRRVDTIDHLLDALATAAGRTTKGHP